MYTANKIAMIYGIWDVECWLACLHVPLFGNGNSSLLHNKWFWCGVTFC